MKKNILVIFTLLIFTLILLDNPTILIKSVNYSINLFIKNIFPTLFPFFILSELLINYNVTYYISKSLNKPFKFLFNLNGITSNVVILSMISGLPSNAKYTKELLDENLIDEHTASNLIAFTLLPNPMFVIGTIGILFLNNKQIGYLILIILYTTNLIIGIILKNKNLPEKIKIKKTTPIKFGLIIKKSIISSINTLLIILGSIIIFVIIGNTILHIFNFNDIVSSVIYSILEITNGLNKICNLDINSYAKLSLIISTLSFTGISVMTQVISILSEYNINYKLIIFYRILAILISNIILLIFFIINKYIVIIKVFF